MFTCTAIATIFISTLNHLDEECNVKVADIGLGKWIERDQSKMYTMPKGTPG